MNKFLGLNVCFSLALCMVSTPLTYGMKPDDSSNVCNASSDNNDWKQRYNCMQIGVNTEATINFHELHPLLAERGNECLNALSTDALHHFDRIAFPDKLREDEALLVLKFRHFMQQTEPYALDATRERDQHMQRRLLHQIEYDIRSNTTAYATYTHKGQKHVFGFVRVNDPEEDATSDEREQRARGPRANFDLLLSCYIKCFTSKMIHHAIATARTQGYSDLSTVVADDRGLGDVLTDPQYGFNFEKSNHWGQRYDGPPDTNAMRGFAVIRKTSLYTKQLTKQKESDNE